MNSSCSRSDERLRENQTDGERKKGIFFFTERNSSGICVCSIRRSCRVCVGPVLWSFRYTRALLLEFSSPRMPRMTPYGPPRDTRKPWRWHFTATDAGSFGDASWNCKVVNKSLRNYPFHSGSDDIRSILSVFIHCIWVLFISTFLLSTWHITVFAI